MTSLLREAANAKESLEQAEIMGRQIGDFIRAAEYAPDRIKHCRTQFEYDFEKFNILKKLISLKISHMDEWEEIGEENFCYLPNISTLINFYKTEILTLNFSLSKDLIVAILKDTRV